MVKLVILSQLSNSNFLYDFLKLFKVGKLRIVDGTLFYSLVTDIENDLPPSDSNLNLGQ